MQMKKFHISELSNSICNVDYKETSALIQLYHQQLRLPNTHIIKPWHYFIVFSKEDLRVKTLCFLLRRHCNGKVRFQFYTWWSTVSRGESINYRLQTTDFHCREWFSTNRHSLTKVFSTWMWRWVCIIIVTNRRPHKSCRTRSWSWQNCETSLIGTKIHVFHGPKRCKKCTFMKALGPLLWVSYTSLFFTDLNLDNSALNVSKVVSRLLAA